jgi:hypothetical protein
MIIGTEKGNLSDIVRDLKSFTSRHIRKAIESSELESRKSWILWMFDDDTHGMTNQIIL